MRSALFYIGCLLVSLIPIPHGLAAEVGVFDSSKFDEALWGAPKDSDSDGIPDSSDAFPFNPAETADSDLDSIGDNADAFPSNPKETLDTDSDGIGNNVDTDDDGDGVDDELEVSLGTDPLDSDTDADGVNDKDDLFPLNAGEQRDLDLDGIGDNADLDDDGDGLDDEWDPDPAQSNLNDLARYSYIAEKKSFVDAEEYAKEAGGHIVTINTVNENQLIYALVRSKLSDETRTQLGQANDGGGSTYVWLGATDRVTEGLWIWITDEAFDYTNWGNAEPDDFDGQDGSAMGLEDWPFGASSSQRFGAASEWNDIDLENRLTFVIEYQTAPIDSDGDGVFDGVDAFPENPAESRDTDNDGVGDNSDVFPQDASECCDRDGDGYGDNLDRFPDDARDWQDSDLDGTGDNADEFPLDRSEQSDSDGDGVGDNSDAFPSDPSETLDTDSDGIGNNIDQDDDDDGLADKDDPYPLDENNFKDSDRDGLEDLSDWDDDNDGVRDGDDVDPLDPREPFTQRLIYAYGELEGVWNGNSATSSSTFYLSAINNSNLPIDVLAWRVTDGLGEIRLESDLTGETLELDGTIAYGARFSAGIQAPVEMTFEFVHPVTGDSFKKTAIFDPAGIDSDGDGVIDELDAFPNDPLEAQDDDLDGVGNNVDRFSSDPTEAYDTDLDGIGDSTDPDDDGDGFTDQEELADGTDPLSRFSCRSGCFSFDIDEDGDAKALTDGLLVIRYLFGFSGNSLVSGATAADGLRVEAEAISTYLSEAGSELDIDGDGEPKALTDGLLLIRYLFGFSGNSLVSGAIGNGAERDTAEEIESHIKSRLPRD